MQVTTAPPTDIHVTPPSANRPRRVVGKYFLSKTLGSGSMGKVKLALNTDTREKVAVKIVTRTSKSLSKKERDAEIAREIRTIREASMMLLLDHPNIAKVYEMHLIDNFYYLFMEYVDGGQLLDYIISHGRLKEVQARHIARQIASAIDYCHRNSIVHRDLKVENILISSNGTIKVIDFGLSNVFSPNSQLSTFCGSLYFAAPELLEGKLYVGPEVDVWSFGIVLFVLVCGQVPFDDPTMQGMHAKVKRGYIDYPPFLSSDIVSLLERMIVVNPGRRATMTEVIGHTWMNKGYDAPVKNYVPKRKPLQLPIDMNVVRGMQGFEFGTEEQIKKELEFIISSQEYQQTATELQHRSLRPYQPDDRSRRRSFSLAMTDPQSMPAAYHPLISIYYLVQERMKRDDGISDSDEEELNPMPVVGVAYTASGKKEVHDATLQQEQDMKRALLEPPTHLELSNDPIDKKPNILRRLSRRLSRSQQTAAVAPIIIPNSHQEPLKTQENTTPTTPLVQLNGTPVEDQQQKEFETVPLTRSVSITAPRNDQQVPSKGHRRQASAATAGSRMVEIDDPSALLALPTSPSDPLVLQSLSPTLSHSSSLMEDSLGEGQADDKVKSVYVKGLFSVSTTSNKKPSAIRQELMRVLEKLNLHYRETKGRFVCHTMTVHFDIYIVKIPWLLGMRGVQFRRVEGDPWKYKNICSAILENLKL